MWRQAEFYVESIGNLDKLSTILERSDCKCVVFLQFNNEKKTL